MFDFTKILLEAQGGEAMLNLARRFGLSPDQSRAAVEAMMPAFAAAMQRQMTDPQALASLFALMTGQPQPPRNPYLDAMAAFSPDAVEAGNAALKAIFGSNEVTRAVADQAAAMSGIGQGVLQAMMPVVAAMLMGGLAESMSKTPVGEMLAGFFAASRPQSGYGAFGDMMGRFVREGAEKGPAAFADMMRQMAAAMPRPTGGTETVEEFLRRAPNPAGPNSLFDEAFGAFVRGFNRGRPEPEKRPEPGPGDDFGAFVGQMFQAGQNVQANQMQAFEQIFDRFWGKR